MKVVEDDSSLTGSGFMRIAVSLAICSRKYGVVIDNETRIVWQ